MAGICGGVGTAAPELAGLLRGIAHRGHATRRHEEGGVGLGQVASRSPSVGATPAVDPASGCALVLDGVVYNRDELHASLARPGAGGGRAAEADGDAGLLARGLALHGPAFLDRVNGVYSLAWWDPRTRRLGLARDPAGVKSVHFVARDGGFAFASETKALLPLVAPIRLDPAGLAAYLRYHFVPAEETVVAGVRRLRQGTVLLVDESGREVGRHATASWPPQPRPGAAPADVWAWLRATMARQLDRARPCGVFLSAGIDSSVLAALAVQESAAPVHTWTVGFDALEGTARDERDAAADLAARLGTRHASVRLTGEQVLRDLESIAWDFDGPLGEGGAVPTWYAAGAARGTVDTVFIGEGSDSLFAGGGQYKAQMRFERWARFAPKGHAVAALAGSLLPGKAGGAARAVLRPSPSERYSSLIEVYRPEHLRRARLPRAGLPVLQPGWTFMDLDRHGLLPDNYYPKIDMCCGARGLEGRLPYTDRQLAALCDPLPVEWKIGPPEKKVLREAATPHLGDAAVRKKQGYSTPLLPWANGAFRDDVARALQEPQAVHLGLLGEGQWQALRALAGAAELHEQRRRWMLYGLDLWLRGVARRGLA